MKKSFLIGCALLLLAGCAAAAKTRPVNLEERLGNPLFAERYYEELVDRMVNLLINDKEILSDKKKQAEVDGLRAEYLKKAQEQTRKRNQGLYGNFVAVKEPTQGGVLLVDNTLNIGTDFLTYPGPALRVYVSKILDPRDAKSFPDPSSIDLGQLASPYGAQEYPLPATTDSTATGSALRSVVLYDTTLNRIYGFAQISPMFK